MRSHSDSVLMRSVQYSLQFHHMIIPITHTTVAYRYHHHRSATDKIFLPTNQPSPPPPPYQLLDRSLTCNHSIISGGSDPLWTNPYPTLSNINTHLLGLGSSVGVGVGGVEVTVASRTTQEGKKHAWNVGKTDEVISIRDQPRWPWHHCQVWLVWGLKKNS